MAAPMKGIFVQRFAQPYSGAGVWGTGINDVHMFYGSPPARLIPINPMENLPGEQHDITPPHEAVPQREPPGYQWGYVPEDSTYTTLDTDNRVTWGVSTEDSPVRFSSQGQPPLNATGAAKNRFRDTLGGAYQTWRGKLPRADYRIPNETVNEGWLNKPNFGPVAMAKPSDPIQYEVQTSMEQRFQIRDNRASLARGTDEPREPIASRVQPQRSPVYSTGQRLYDMFPRQQHPDTEREFYYRTAGTGVPDWMETNEQWDINAVERTPPPDPYVGTPDTSSQLQFGYSEEDYFYA
jgi:hypothetical protein